MSNLKTDIRDCRRILETIKHSLVALMIKASHAGNKRLEAQLRDSMMRLLMTIQQLEKAEKEAA